MARLMAPAKTNGVDKGFMGMLEYTGGKTLAR